MKGPMKKHAFKKMASITAKEIWAHTFHDEVTFTRALPKKPGLKGMASRGVDRLLGRKGTETLAARVYGGLSWHPYNLISQQDRKYMRDMAASVVYKDSSSGGKSGPVPSRSTRTQRPRRVGSKSPHRPSRRPSSGRRRKRCTHQDRRGRRCLRPAGHSGRHRYQ